MGDRYAVAMARAKITVQKLRSEAIRPDGEALMEIHINEIFRGDIDGESAVRALQVFRGDKSASLVSLQRFRGTLHGRRGTFVLQGSETVDGGKIEAMWSVVPRSGTGELAGLRGEGGFQGDFGCPKIRRRHCGLGYRSLERLRPPAALNGLGSISD